MCKTLDIIKTGIKDIKNHRKSNVISFLLIFISLIVYLGVNSHSRSITNEINKSVNFFEGRIVVALLYEDEYEETLSYFKELYGDDERVREIREYAYTRLVEWKDTMDILYVESTKFPIFGFYEAVLDFDYKGEKREPKKDEIILPRYICDIGIYDTTNIGNADELIGETIVVEYSSLDRRDTREYEFKVIGTYDNLEARMSDYKGIVNTQIMLDIKDIEDKAEELAEEELKIELGDDYDEGYEYIKDRLFSVYVKEGYDVDEFIKEVGDKTNHRVHFSRNKEIVGSVEGYYKYIIVIGSIVSLMLLFIGIINIIVSSINEVKSRKWEFALKMSMGYTKRDIILTFFVEKFVNLVKALLLAIFTVGLYCIIITYISRNFLEYWKRGYLYIIYPDNMLIALFLVFIAGLIGVLVARLGINEINIAKELKSEE